MGEFNERINDPVFIDTNLYDNLSRISLTEGFNFGMSVSYRPFQFISLGVYGGYQFGKTERDIRIINYDPFWPNDTFPGKRTFKTESIQVGVVSSFIFNQLNFWKNKSSLSRIESSLNLQVGYGWANLITDDDFEGEDVTENDMKSLYSSSGFQIVSSYKLGYILSNNRYFSSIGLKIGYQLFKTSDLQAEGGLFYPHNKKTKLDFSGFNIGLYLSIGR